MARSTSCRQFASGEGGLNRYLQEIRQFPMLARKKNLCWPSAGKNMPTAKPLSDDHQPFAPGGQDCHGLPRYGLPIGEVISEGNVGLMQAVKRLSPTRASGWRPMPCGGSRPPSRNMCCALGLS